MLVNFDRVAAERSGEMQRLLDMLEAGRASMTSNPILTKSHRSTGQIRGFL